jgi:hypothetical protein
MNRASATMTSMTRMVHNMVGLRPLLVVHEASLVQRCLESQPRRGYDETLL